MKAIKKLYLFLIFLFLYAPIFVLIALSFNEGKSRNNFTGFTLDWYVKMFQNSDIMNALVTTIQLALLSAIIATIFGTIAAIGIFCMKKKMRSVVMNISYLPVSSSDLVTGISLLMLFVFIGIKNGFSTLLIAHITFSTPYVILNVLPKLTQVNRNLYEAAQDLGASPSYAFRKVILPEIKPGVITGFIMALTLSIDDFIISYFVGGNGVQTLSMKIYSMAKLGIKPEINALSTLLFIVIFTLLLLVNVRSEKSENVRVKKQRVKLPKVVSVTFKSVAAVLVVTLSFGILTYNTPFMQNLISPNGSNVNTNRELKIFNCGEYIGEGIIEKFEEETGIKVTYDEFATNEEMYSKIKKGGTDYDILIPSDYMITKLINEDYLQRIDVTRLSNFDKLDPKMIGREFDEGNDYTVPYMWGTLGILYDKTLVNEPVNSFDILWDKKYQNAVFMIDSMRDTMGVALKRLGYSMNSTDPNEIEHAKNELIKQKKDGIFKAYTLDEVKDNMVGAEAKFALCYSGEAMYVIDENPDIAYVVPDNGSNIWFDCMVMPKVANNVEEAYEFMDFMCRTDIALENAIYTGYSTPQMEARKQLPEEIKNNKVAYPDDEVLDKCEAFKDLGSSLELYDAAWTEYKISTK